jgi:streptogramin lyase
MYLSNKFAPYFKTYNLTTMKTKVYQKFKGLALGFALLCAGSASAQQPAGNCGRTYTSNEDFEEGSLLSLNYSIPGSLRLDQPGKPLPYINIACSGRGTVARINVNTGQVIGEYLTSPDGRLRNPSRTTVDKFGNVWVTNRDENGIVDGIAKGSVARIGIVIGGRRCNADGSLNPTGQYLKPPFKYNTCVDRDGDGLIKTSIGLGNILGWSNAGGADNNGGVSTADDEAIINYTRVFATGARTVAVDEFNDLWVGGSGNRFHEKLDGNTGQPIPGTLFNVGAGGYGGSIDANGILWSAGAPNNPLLKFNTNGTPFPATELLYTHGDYGIGIDPNTGEVWSSYVEGNRIAKISPSGELLGVYAHGNFHSQGVAVDAVGNVWVAHSLINNTTTVGRLRTDGTYVGNVELGGFAPTGVAVDANGKVWATCLNSNTIKRIDPNAGPIGGGGFPIGAVDLSIDLGSGATPYNYSDMTGFVVVNCTKPSGSWTTVHDGGTAGKKWGRVMWTDSIPVETGIRVEVRASDSELTLGNYPFVEVEKGASFCCAGVTGRFVEIRTSLFRSTETFASPVLFDLTIECCDVYQSVPPVLTSSSGCNPSDTIRVVPGQTRTFTFNATDADSDQTVTLSANLPEGATLTPIAGNPLNATFSWTPTEAQLGVYTIRFAANDDYCYEDVCEKTIKVQPEPPGCFATEVLSYTPGLNGNGTAVRPERSISTNALGAPDGQSPVIDAPVQNFVSLGYGGAIEIAFAERIANGPGADIRIWESSIGSNNERSRIEVSQDGLGYTPVGEISQDGEVDFGTAFSSYIQFVRIVDLTTPASSGQFNDGFDVDAVECLHGAYVYTPCFATQVISFEQGNRLDGTSVSSDRSNTTNALGEAEPVVTGTVNFTSLGFGGSITLGFDYPIANGPGADVQINEATWNNPTCASYPESADVFASQNGSDFVYCGRVCRDGNVDLGPLSWAAFIRIVDASEGSSFSANDDGYDVNGISCLNGAAINLTDDGLVGCSLQEIVSYTPGNRKNATPVGAPRNNPANALGTPQNNNTINFTALGFGGTLVGKFDFVVFNQPGNDLRVTETSFGNPSCNNYPEKARVSVSMDNVNWTELGEICLDGEIDLGSVNYAQYIKIQDASPISSNKFNGAADGYDIDAVVVLNNGCGASSARLAQMDNSSTPDASLAISAFPNPVEDYTIVSFEGLENDSDFNFQIMDAAGRVIRNQQIRVMANNSTYLFNASELARGIYQVIISNENGSQIIRLVK